jgi:hypothetical protein
MFTKRKFEWQNVPSAEKKLHLRRLGKWLADQTRQEKEQSLQSAFASAAEKLSEQHSAKEKSKIRIKQIPLPLFFIFTYASARTQRKIRVPEP